MKKNPDIIGSKYVYTGSYDKKAADYLLAELIKPYKKMRSFITHNPNCRMAAIMKYWSGIKQTPLNPIDIEAIYEAGNKSSGITLDMLLTAFGYVRSSDIRNVLTFVSPEPGDLTDLRVKKCREKVEHKNDEAYKAVVVQETAEFIKSFKYDGDPEDVFLQMACRKQKELVEKNSQLKLHELKQAMHGKELVHNDMYDMELNTIGAMFNYI